MRDHDHHGSGQVGGEHADAGQTGHETGHGSLRRRLRQVLKGGVRGLAGGLLADDLHRLGEEIQCLRASVMEAAGQHAEVGLELADAGYDHSSLIDAVRAILAELDAWKGASGLTSSIAPNAVTPDNLRLVLRDSKAYCQKLQAEVDAWKAKADRLKAENDDLKRTNANLHEAFEREHKEAAALRRRLAGPATMPTAGAEDVEPDAWCGRCDTPLGRRPTQGEVNVTCSGCGAVLRPERRVRCDVGDAARGPVEQAVVAAVRKEMERG